MVPVNVYAYAVLSTPQILGFTSGYILIFLRGTPQNLTRLHAYASGSPDDPCKLTFWTSKSGLRMVCFVHFDLGKCASRHNGVHFFDISTAKSGPHP